MRSRAANTILTFYLLIFGVALVLLLLVLGLLGDGWRRSEATRSTPRSP